MAYLIDCCHGDGGILFIVCILGFYFSKPPIVTESEWTVVQIFNNFFKYVTSLGYISIHAVIVSVEMNAVIVSRGFFYSCIIVLYFS